MIGTWGISNLLWQSLLLYLCRHTCHVPFYKWDSQVKGKSMCDLGKHYQMPLHKGLYHSALLPAMYENAYLLLILPAKYSVKYLIGMNWYLSIVSLWISLIMNETEHLFICLKTILISCFIHVFCSFFYWVVHLLPRSSFHVKEISSLSLIGIINIFPSNLSLVFWFCLG